jgi:FkbM family methyltransferase
MSFADYVRRYNPQLWFFFKHLRYKYVKGERELRFMRLLVQDDKIAIDIGSSIGLYAKELAKHTSKVFAFEANPLVASFAKQIAPRNVEVINVALSSRDGRMTLRIPINHRNNPVSDLATVEAKNELPYEKIITVDVATKRLDDYDFSSCGFIKIDVEGHEEAVLDGGWRLIETHRPVLMIELVDSFNPGTIKRVNDRLSDLSYAAYFLSEDRLQPFEKIGRDFEQKINAIGRRPSSRSRKAENVNNFIFLPKEAVSMILKRF